MAAEQNVVGEGDAVADLAIVRDVSARHQETTLADFCEATVVLGAGIDGDVFANVAVGADR